MCEKEVEQVEVGTDPCVICLDPIQDPATLPCFHVFCFECIIVGAQTFSLSRCAVCRTPFSTVSHRGIQEPVIHPAGHSQREVEEERTGTRIILTSQTRRREDRIDMRSVRRNIYLRRLYSRPLVEEYTDGWVRIKDTSPDFYRQNPAALHQLVPFMHRDLRLFLPSPIARQLEQNLIQKFKSHSITSEAVNAYLQPHIGRFSPHFLHEVRNYAQCVYHMKKYDRMVRYRRRHLSTQPDIVPDSNQDTWVEEGEIIEVV